MTAITSHQVATTSFDRVLLRAASALDAFVTARVERRGARVPAALADHDASRARAQALGAIGIMPR